VAGQLIVSVSGVSDRTLTEVDAFCELLDARGVPASFLVAPRIKGGYRLDSDAPTVEWLADRRERGDAIVLHGFDEAATKKRRGEFATLPAHEANLRLMAADRVLEHLGLRTRLFAAPGWTVSQGTVTALPRNGFRLLAGLSGITDLARPDFGEPVAIYQHEVTMFWACGVTPQAVALAARPDLMITHEPGIMFLTDLPRDQDIRSEI